jgi:mRNA-degrading endonuclease toxin of MazEF toxin-antitoxin module
MIDKDLLRECVVNLDEIQTIWKERLIRVLTTVSQEAVVQADQAFKFARGLQQVTSPQSAFNP